MAGVLELGGVAAMTLASTTCLSLNGVGQDGCTKHLRRYMREATGLTARHHRKRFHLDPPHRQQLLECPFTCENVGVRAGMTDLTENRRATIEFNGEVLSMRSDTGVITPLVTLGACSVRMGPSGSLVIIKPPTVPDIEVVFASDDDAQVWAEEFRSAICHKVPHHRVQELIRHSMTVDAYLVNLRRQVSEVRELEHQNASLNAALRKKKDGNVEPEAKPKPSLLRSRTMSLVKSASWGVPFIRSASLTDIASEAMDAEKIDRLNQELRQHRDEHAQAEALALSLKVKLADHVPPEVHRSVHEQMQQHKQEMADANQEAAQLRRRRDELTKRVSEAKAEVGRQQVVSNPRGMLQDLDAKRDTIAKDFEQRFQDVERALVISRSKLREEQARSASMAARLQIANQDRETLKAQLEELQCQPMSESVTPEDSKSQQLQMAVKEMMVSFNGHFEAQRANYANQIAEQNRKHSMDVEFLKSGSSKSLGAGPALTANDSEWSLKLRDLAEENMSLKSRMVQKGRVVGSQSLGNIQIGSVIESSQGSSSYQSSLLQTPTRATRLPSIYSKPQIERTGSGITAVLGTTTAYTVPSSPESEQSSAPRLQSVSRLMSSPGRPIFPTAPGPPSPSMGSRRTFPLAPGTARQSTGTLSSARLDTGTARQISCASLGSVGSATMSGSSSSRLVLNSSSSATGSSPVLRQFRCVEDQIRFHQLCSSNPSL